MEKIIKANYFFVASAVALLILVFAVFATTSLVSPTLCTGTWNSCSNANADNSAVAKATNGKSGSWYGFGFSIPSDAVINSVKVRADFFATTTSGYLDVKASNNNGLNYGPAHRVGGNTAEQTFWIDVTNDFVWTPNDINNYLRVQGNCVKQGGGNPTCQLDWLPVEVVYTVPQFDFSVSANPSSGSAEAGTNAQTTVTVTLVSGVTQSVSLSQTGCPPSSTCTFTPGSGNPTFTSTFDVATSSSTPAGTYPVNLIGTSGSTVRSTTYTLEVTASNSPPSLSSVNLTPVNPTVNDNLLATPNGLSDPNGNANEDDINYNWKVNGNSLALLNMPFTNNEYSADGLTTLDFSGNGLNGQLFGTNGGSSDIPAFTSANCTVGGCYRFNAGNYIKVNDSTSKLLSMGNYYSAVFWYHPEGKKTSPGIQKIVYDRSAYSTVPNEGYLIPMRFGVVVNDMSWVLYIDQTNSSKNDMRGLALGFNQPDSPNTKKFVAITFNGDTGTFTASNGTTTQTVTGMLYGPVLNADLETSFSLLGSMYDGTSTSKNRGVNGTIDDFVLYNKILSPQQITALYNNGQGASTTLVSQELASGQVWSVGATPIDQQGLNGATVTSNSVTVQ